MRATDRPWQTFWLAAATIFMVSLDATVIVAAFPALRGHFNNSSAATLSWTINGYTIVFAALLVPFGRVVDRFGHWRCFLVSTGGFTLASAACALAPSAEGLIAARVLQAISAAMISPASLALILAAFSPEQRSRSAGLWSAVGALAAASGPAIGSILIEWISWRMIFLINLPIGIAVFALAHQRLPKNTAHSRVTGFDGIGTLLIVLGVGGIATGLTQAGETNLLSASVLPYLIVGIVLLIGFPFWAARRKEAAIDIRLFDHRDYRWACLGTLILGIAFGLMFLAFYLFFTGVWRYPQWLAGLAATPGPLLATVTAIAISSRISRYNSKHLLLGGGILFAASNAWLAVRISPDPAYLTTWLPSQISGGIAIGLMLPALAGAAVSRLQTDQLGIGSAVNNAIRQLGSALGVALGIAIVGEAKWDAEPFRFIYVSLTVCGCLVAATATKLHDRSSAS
jgi:EmrB/QacA subfamily drug resistance transporter